MIKRMMLAAGLLMTSLWANAGPLTDADMQQWLKTQSQLAQLGDKHDDVLNSMDMGELLKLPPEQSAKQAIAHISASPSTKDALKVMAQNGMSAERFMEVFFRIIKVQMAQQFEGNRAQQSAEVEEIIANTKDPELRKEILKSYEMMNAGLAEVNPTDASLVRKYQQQLDVME
ncbi:hypothetical protein [Motilimonas pumila]|uniref:Uncharacterized protein n=1 Tax=Motilimonas pumila TaxID=2303987 RepID=A0A418YDK2_9GAMM|nr:hypothetical protein [Motilimonas pumila]RJG42629.1 hypothetical protein D1Z90_12230 [Motilimonas pumila]